MTQDEINQMVEQAGFHGMLSIGVVMDLKQLETFAKLVAEKEREAWERKFARLQSLMDLRETQPNKPCCLAEREACAKIAEEWAVAYPHPSRTIAVTIRMQGDKHDS
jgi:hypothetical protein